MEEGEALRQQSTNSMYYFHDVGPKGPSHPPTAKPWASEACILLWYRTFSPTDWSADENFPYMGKGLKVVRQDSRHGFRRPEINPYSHGSAVVLTGQVLRALFSHFSSFPLEGSCLSCMEPANWGFWVQDRWERVSPWCLHCEQRFRYFCKIGRAHV